MFSNKLRTLCLLGTCFRCPSMLQHKLYYWTGNVGKERKEWNWQANCTSFFTIWPSFPSPPFTPTVIIPSFKTVITYHGFFLKENVKQLVINKYLQNILKRWQMKLPKEKESLFTIRSALTLFKILVKVISKRERIGAMRAIWIPLLTFRRTCSNEFR